MPTEENEIFQGYTRAQRERMAQAQEKFEAAWPGCFASREQRGFSAGHSADGHWVGISVDTGDSAPVHITFKLQDALDLLMTLQLVAAAALDRLESGEGDEGRA